MLACNIAEKAAAARGAFAISSMAADTKTKDDWPSLLPPPPKFNVPPPPIPAFVEACRHPPNPHDSTVNMEVHTFFLINFFSLIIGASMNCVDKILTIFTSNSTIILEISVLKIFKSLETS